MPIDAVVPRSMLHSPMIPLGWWYYGETSHPAMVSWRSLKSKRSKVPSLLRLDDGGDRGGGDEDGGVVDGEDGEPNESAWCDENWSGLLVLRLVAVTVTRRDSRLDLYRIHCYH